MEDNQNYASLVLGNKGKVRQLSLTLLVLIFFLILFRLPFAFSKPLLCDTNQTALISFAETVGSFVKDKVSADHIHDFKFMHRYVRYGISLLHIAIWLFLSVYLYKYMENKLDDTIACFVLWLLILAPASLYSTGVSTSIFVAPFVVAVLLLAVEIYDRGTLIQYVAGGVLAASTTIFGFNNVLLLVPLLFSHFFSAREPKQSFFRLFFSIRFFGLISLFGIVFALINPSLINHVIEKGSILSVFDSFHPAYFFGYSLVGNQFRLLYSSAEPFSILCNLSLLLGPLATVITLVGSIYCLFSSSLRNWRPVALYILLAIPLRIITGFPSFDSASELIPPMVIILSVNILHQVSRVGYRFQKTLFVSLALLFSISPLWMIGKTTFTSRFSDSQVYLSSVIESEINLKGIVQVGVFVASTENSIKLPLPYTKEISSQRIFEYWAKTLQPVSALKKGSASYVIVNKQFLRKLAKKIESPALSKRVKKILAQFNELKPYVVEDDLEYRSEDNTENYTIYNLRSDPM